MIYCDAEHSARLSGIQLCLLLVLQDELQYSLPFVAFFRRSVANPCISFYIKETIESTRHELRPLGGENWGGIVNQEFRSVSDVCRF